MCVFLLVLTRIVFKRDQHDAADGIVLAKEVRLCKRINNRLAILGALWSHIMFATEGAQKVCLHLRSSPDWSFTRDNLKVVRSLIAPLELKHQRKLSDLSVTLTGTAWIDRILDGKGAARRLQRLEQCMAELLEAGVFTKSQLSFDIVHKITLRLPLYGKTRSLNLTRSLSGAREAVGLPPLEYDEIAFKAVVDMHVNVRTSLELLEVHDYEEAHAACQVLSALVALSYSDRHQRAGCRVLDEGGFALICCEYHCALKDLSQRKICVGTELERCNWLLRRLPHTLVDIQELRRRVVAHCARSPEVDTGNDDARCRNMLRWWLSSKPTQTSGIPWPKEIIHRCICDRCGDVKPMKRIIDPRARFCDRDCQKEFQIESGPAQKKWRR